MESPSLSRHSSPPVSGRECGRNAAQMHVWPTQIVLLSAEGRRTNAIMRQTGKPKDLCLALVAALHGRRF